MIWILEDRLMEWLWETLEYLGEIRVFIGVMGEVVTERKSILKDDEGTRGAVEGIASWILVAGLAISLAALIGTNGYFNRTIALLNLQARQAGERAAQDERDAAEARKEADSFQSQIADSAARTKEAESKIASAEAEARDAAIKVATADARIADAQEKAAEANKTSESERLERVQLQEDIAPRRLSLAERKKISEQLSGGARVGAIVEYGTGDTEAYEFGVDIAKAVELAYWRPSEPHDVMEMGLGPFAFGHVPSHVDGVIIETCPNAISRKTGSELRNGLIALGFDTIVQENCDWGKYHSPPLPNPEAIRVNIRPRREGAQGEAKLRHETKPKYGHRPIISCLLAECFTCGNRTAPLPFLPFDSLSAP